MKCIDFFGRRAVKVYLGDKKNLLNAFPHATKMLISTLETMGDELIADDAQGTQERLEAYLLLQLAQTAVGKTVIWAEKQRKAHESTPLFLFARHLPGLYAAAKISGQDDVASKLLELMREADESIPTTYLTAVVEKAQLRGPGSRAWKNMQREVAAAIDALTPKQVEPTEEALKALKELIAKAEMEDAPSEEPTVMDEAAGEAETEPEGGPEGEAEEAVADPVACQEDCEDCADSPLVCGHGRREARAEQEEAPQEMVPAVSSAPATLTETATERMEIIGYSKIAQENLAETLLRARGFVVHATQHSTKEAMAVTKADEADAWIRELAAMQLLAYCVDHVTKEVTAGTLKAVDMDLPLCQAVSDAMKYLAKQAKDCQMRFIHLGELGENEEEEAENGE